MTPQLGRRPQARTSRSVGSKAVAMAAYPASLGWKKSPASRSRHDRGPVTCRSAMTIGPALAARSTVLVGSAGGTGGLRKRRDHGPGWDAVDQLRERFRQPGAAHPATEEIVGPREHRDQVVVPRPELVQGGELLGEQVGHPCAGRGQVDDPEGVTSGGQAGGQLPDPAGS